MARWLLILPLGVLVALVGCNDSRRCAYVAQRPYTCNQCMEGPLPPRNRPVPYPGYPPRRAPAVTEGAATFVPPSGNVPPPPASLGQPVPPTTTNEPPPATVPPAGGNLPPSTAPSADLREGDVRLGAPAPIRRDSARAKVPESKEPPVASVPGKPGTSEFVPDSDATKDLPQPIDLPGFAIATQGVASGLKPFPDGINWLVKKGYKTALYLHAPGEDVTATKRLFEMKGLKFIALEASPARMSKALYEEFVKQVKKADLQPLFVFDKDGSTAGGLWYLYYRVELQETEVNASKEAQRLGLRTDDDPEHKAMWLAVQTLEKSLLP